jgi:pimeloyl-ACP methyl ester carboxylesterase
MPFELAGADGGPLRGEVRTGGDGTGRPPVVMCHGFKGSKDWGFFPTLAERLARAGMTAVSFNFSGSGVGPEGGGVSEPERFARSTFSNDVRDIGTVCAALTAGTLADGLVKMSGFGLFGHSRGGGAAVLVAAANPDVRALATWAAISHTNRWDEATVARWRSDGKRIAPGVGNGAELFFYTDMLDDIERNAGALDIARAAGRLRAPWLIIHGDADSFVPVSEGIELHEAANRPNAELCVLQDGTHTFGVDGGPAGGRLLEAAVDRTLGWFLRHLY